LAIYGGVELLWGETEWGLGTWTATFHPQVAWKLDRFQLGVGYFMSAWVISRITSRHDLVTAAFGVRTDASVDLAEFGDFSSLYLGLGGWLGGGAEVAYGGVASLGYRL
jgi:hypothetical protein